jgi:uncharacterized protein
MIKKVGVLLLTLMMAETVFSDGKEPLQKQMKHMEIKEKIAPYADKKTFTEKEFEAGLKEWPLPVTLTIPNGIGPFPAVVLVHGSGPNDRDETLFENKPFRDIAWGLATRGIAVLRYDKRTFHYKAKLIPHLKRFTLNEETVDDAVAMVKHLAEEPRIDRNKIYVLGHSLGGMAIPRIARKDKNKQAAGFIVLAGVARPFEDLILEQFRYMVKLDGKVEPLEKTLLENTEKQVALIKSKKLSVDTPPGQLIPGTFGAYWLDLRGYRPASEAAGMSRPLLILQGGRDYNVTMVDFNIWKSKLTGRKNVRFKSFPDLNHLMIEGKGKSTPMEYQTPGHVAEEVIDTIYNWIKSH